MFLLSELLASPFPSESVSAQRKTYVTYSFPSLKDPLGEESQITLLESRSLILSSGTTGFRTWEAALHLATFLATRNGQCFVRNRVVKELGAGTGFLSILCAKHFEVQSILATDGSPAITEDIIANSALNGLEHAPNIQAKVYQWGQSLPAEEREGLAPDTLLGADIV